MNTVDCLISCGCWKRLRLDAAKTNTSEGCPHHLPLAGTSLYIVKVNTHEWHVRCQTTDCHYGRWFGQSEGLARRANGRHATTYAHLGGVAYDKVTWDRRGQVFTQGRGPRAYTLPSQPPQSVKKTVTDYGPPPF